MLLATALALLITGCAQQTFTVQNKPAAVAPKPSPIIISSFLELGRRKLSMQPKFVAAQKILLKQKWQTFVNGLLSFITLGIILLEAHVLPQLIAWICLSRYGQLYLHYSLIYFWVPSSCLHSDPASLWGWNNPVIVCQSGGGCIIHAGGGGGFTLFVNCFDVQPTTTSGSIITQSIIFSFSIND